MTSATDLRRGALDAIDRIVHAGATPDDVLQRAVDLLHDRFEHYSWVGIYLVEGEELRLGAWQGPEATEHVRIPIGAGICGAAAASGRMEVVDDVQADSRYLACFPSTRSEIVVPIHFHGEVVGEIDVDSDTPSAFDGIDQRFLEHVARMLSSPCAAALGRFAWGAEGNTR
jgi:GAF domain-containing protein